MAFHDPIEVARGPPGRVEDDHAGTCASLRVRGAEMQQGDTKSRSGRQEGSGLRTAALVWIGAIVGVGLDNAVFGALVGGAFGYLISQAMSARQQLRGVTESLEALQRRLSEFESAGAGTRPAEPVATPEAGLSVDTGRPTAGAPSPIGTVPGTLTGTLTGTPAPVAPRSEAARPPASAIPGPGPAAPPPARPRPPQSPNALDRGVGALRGFLFGGNTVVRVGVIVLLVGVALLAKYAADNALFPIEMRLASAALIGLALTVVGYRLRAARPGFGISLQGGGIAALYLVVFFAFRIYGLVPAGLAFTLFVATAVACGALAVMQSAQPLLVIGSLGGFAAPLLASTGEGSHVFLFGFYLVLNAGVAAVAWFRSWRVPPLIAFVATYGVATVWGVLRYRPDDYATTQPFVIAFLVLFTGVAIVHAFREHPKLRGPIDGALVFGTPLLSLLAQARLVEDTEFGLAISAAVLGIAYAVLASWLWRVQAPSFRPLAEAFIALAVGFATMAIPLAFETSLTVTVAWAFEGAGLYWIGVRQERRLARFSGVALHALAALAFFVAVSVDDFDRTDFVVFANGRFLSCLALALAGFLIGRQADVHRERVSGFEWRLAQLFGGFGLLWWAIGLGAEIDQFVARSTQAAATVAAVGASALALEAAARWRGWQTGRLLALAAIPALAVLLPIALDDQPHLLANGGFVAWPFALFAIHFVIGRLEDGGPGFVPRAYAPAFWLLVVTVGMAFGGIADVALGLSDDWGMAAAGSGAALAWLFALYVLDRDRGAWGRHDDMMLTLGMTPVAGLAAFWWLAVNCSARGDGAPLPYAPILNPVDASLGLVAVAVLAWWVTLRRHLDRLVTPARRRAMIGLAAASLFLWLNAILARSVHQWTGVRFRLDPLWHSVALQSSLSIAWTLVALGGMLVSTRRGLRTPWMVFAGLLGVVVAKLFLVDLSQLSTVTKIGTFLVVGVLLLIVGYLTPVPPNRPDEPDALAEAEEIA